VLLDYSHIGPAHRSYRFVQNKISDDYFLATQIDTIPDGEKAVLKTGLPSQTVPFFASTHKKLFLKFKKYLEQEAKAKNEEEHYNAGERTGMFLEGLDRDERKYVTNVFGEEKLGGYAIK